MRIKIILIFFLLFLPSSFFLLNSISFAQTWEELNNKVIEYYQKGDYKTAIIWAEKAVKQADIEFGIKHKNYATSLNNLAELYKNMGRYSEAEPLYKEAIKIVKEVLGEKHPDYATALNNLAELYYYLGLYKKAELLFQVAMEIRKEVLGVKNTNYATSLNNLAGLFLSMGRYSEAEPLFKEAMKIRKEVLGENHPDYAQSLNNLALLYNFMGRYTEAEPLYKEAMKIRKEVLGEKHPDYATSLNNLALLYNSMGRYSEAEPLYKETMKILKEVLGKNHPSYATSLNNLALLYYYMGRYIKAEPLYKEAMKIRKEVLGEKHPDYAMSLNNLAGLYKTMGRYSEAEPLYKEAMKIYKEVLGEKHTSYAGSINNLAVLYDDMGRYTEAEPLFKEALKIIKEVLGENHPDYATSLNNLALLYYYMGRYSEAEPLYKEAMKIIKEVLGEKHPYYAPSLNNLAGLYYKMGRYTEAEPLFIESNRNNINYIQNNFPFLSENQKKDFLKTIYYNFEVFYSFSKIRCKDNSSITSNMFDIRLASKGVILNSTVQMFSKIKSSGDENLINKYNELITLKATIIKAQDLTIEERKNRGLNLKELESNAEEIEKELNKAAGIDIFKNVNWQDLKNSLKPNEAAIEFVDFQYYDKRWTDTTFYMALMLKKDYEYPKLITLCTEDEIKSILSIPSENNNSYVRNNKTSIELYNKIWKPLEEYLTDVNSIYISPSGLLNKVSFSAISSANNELLCDKYDLHYVGNLKDVVLKKEEEKQIKSIPNFTSVIFGGADFDLDSAKLKEYSSKFDTAEIKREGDPVILYSDKESYSPNQLVKNGKWTYLEGTKTEAENINSLFKSNNLNSIVYTGPDANKTALKAFSHTKTNNSPTVIHIATHGFFFPEIKKDYEKMHLMQMGNQGLYRASDNPLMRSGLIFAGANTYWQDSTPVHSGDNGILTAYEVSNMDLMNTELVVLSACETGLGDIRGGEGVYGLQRAFKVAGAKTIIMSLWKVPDKETVELMELFYTSWLSGMTKHEAFTRARKEMRNRYPGDPYKWAAFVMVE